MGADPRTVQWAPTLEPCDGRRPYRTVPRGAALCEPAPSHKVRHDVAWVRPKAMRSRVRICMYDDALSRPGGQSRVCLHLYDEALSLLGLAHARAPTHCITVYVYRL